MSNKLTPSPMKGLLFLEHPDDDGTTAERVIY